MRWQRAGIRVRAALGVRPRRHEPVPAAGGAVWHALATPPGNPVALPWGTAPVVAPDPSDPQFRDALAHRFRVLAPHAVHIAYPDAGGARRAAIERLAAGLPADARANYTPIEWHSDVHTGYRWDPAQLYIEVRLAPQPPSGTARADIKIPRELSRFNHVGALARGDLRTGAVEFALQVLDWIAANPRERGPNWACTMDVALRALNWVWGLRLFEPELGRFPAVVQALRTSLWEHGAHIERHLEYYEELTNNHYLSDIAGLLHVAAAFPEFPEADRWLRFSLQELVSEMERETLGDGAAHEASSCYHRLVAELFATCAAVAERIPAARRRRLAAVDPRAHRVRPPLRPAAALGLNLGAVGRLLPAAFYARLRLMGEFTATLTKPNGRVPQFGDNDSGRAHKLLGDDVDELDHRHVVALIAQLCGAGELMPRDPRARAEAELVAGGLAPMLPAAPSTAAPPARLFADTGIAVLRAPRAWVAITCGANGLAGRGGHGHNDKLSFELNVDDQDFIVDGGCPVYTGDPALRNRFRATAAHSTIAVEGLEQDPIPPGPGGLFRLPQRCHPRLALLDGPAAAGSHDGFGVRHTRRFTLEPGRLILEDHFPSELPRTLRFNLDPGVNVELPAPDGASLVLVAARSRLALRVDGASDPRLVEGCYSRGFGVPVATRALELRVNAARVRTEIAWQ